MTAFKRRDFKENFFLAGGVALVLSAVHSAEMFVLLDVVVSPTKGGFLSIGILDM